jgi:hypothetical protein
MALRPHVNTVAELYADEPMLYQASTLQKSFKELSSAKCPSTTKCNSIQSYYGIDTISKICVAGTWFAGLCQLKQTLPILLSLRHCNQFMSLLRWCPFKF